MIKFSFNEKGKLQIGQVDVPPVIYLDHWALRKFSENQALAEILQAALKQRNGTLALSWLNLAEFTRVPIEDQARKAETLLEKILPQIFFLEVDFFEVIRREVSLIEIMRQPCPSQSVEWVLRTNYGAPGANCMT